MASDANLLAFVLALDACLSPGTSVMCLAPISHVMCLAPISHRFCSPWGNASHYLMQPRDRHSAVPGGRMLAKVRSVRHVPGTNFARHVPGTARHVPGTTSCAWHQFRPSCAWHQFRTDFVAPGAMLAIT